MQAIAPLKDLPMCQERCPTLEAQDLIGSLRFEKNSCTCLTTLIN